MSGLEGRLATVHDICPFGTHDELGLDNFLYFQESVSRPVVTRGLPGLWARRPGPHPSGSFPGKAPDDPSNASKSWVSSSSSQSLFLSSSGASPDLTRTPSRPPSPPPNTHISVLKLSPSLQAPSHQPHPWVSAWAPSRTHSGWASSSRARRRLSAGRARACGCDRSPCPPGRRSPGAMAPRPGRSRSRRTMKSWKNRRTRRWTRPPPWARGRCSILPGVVSRGGMKRRTWGEALLLTL